MKTLPTKTSKYGRWRVGIHQHCNAVTLTAHVLEYYASTKNGVQQGGSTVGVALLVVFSLTIFGERHCTGQKGADLCRNDK